MEKAERFVFLNIFFLQIYHGKIIFTSTLEIMKHLLNLAD